jgi:hypothetical protein
MHHQKTQKVHSCGHLRQGTPQALISHSTPALPQSKSERPLHRYSTSTSTNASHSRSPSYIVDENTIFTNPFASSPSSSTSSSASSSRRNSLTKDLTPEERIAAGLEYMAAFLASKSRNGAHLSPASTRPASLANSSSSPKAVRTQGSEDSADRMLRLQMKRKEENERAMAKAVARLM